MPPLALALRQERGAATARRWRGRDRGCASQIGLDDATIGPAAFDAGEINPRSARKPLGER